MKIIIIGAGRVGSSVAENLASEANDITVVDTDALRLRQLQDQFDLSTVVGNGALPSTLREAGARDADLLLAVSQSDQTNLCACRTAASLFHVPTKIARLRSADYADDPQLLDERNFAVDISICPEQIVTDHIVKLIETPEALQVLEFAQGMASLVAVRAETGSPLVGATVADIRRHLPDIDARIAAIYRGSQVILPEGDTTVAAGDEVFCLAATRHIRRVIAELRRRERPTRRILIAGGGNIGYRLARATERGYDVKLIEIDEERAKFLAANLGQTLVLHGDATDDALLVGEGVADIDFFLAVTDDDENNIMASLLAKCLGARRVLALVNRRIYAEVVQSDRIDIAISPAQISIGALLTHVRKADVAVVHSLRRGAAEALELVAHGDRQTSRVVGRRVDELPFPKDVSCSAVVRGKGDARRVIIAHHDTVIESDDHVIIFVANKQLVRKVERLFQVDVAFI
ncbi:MAG: hypothetical protein RLZ44_1259 [Pseudomonadota bacterium]